MPIRALALHAQRIGKVFAAPATWACLIRERGWRRPRQRVYPAKPKEGIRAYVLTNDRARLGATAVHRPTLGQQPSPRQMTGRDFCGNVLG
jgi:hypothetical protein